jgi:hypothetical protein
MALNDSNHVLRPSLVEIYINCLMLGLSDSTTIQKMYEILPNLSDDKGELCNLFSLVYSNNFWFDKSLYN